MNQFPLFPSVVKKDLILNEATAAPTSPSSRIYHLLIITYN